MNAATATDAPAVRPSDGVDRLLNAIPLVSVFAWALLAYAYEAWLMKAPIIFSDELEIASLARSIASTGQPALRGQAYWNHSLVPFLFAPAWLVSNTQVAYQLAKFTGVLFMTATVFPTYALARMLVPRRYALFAAAGAVAVPTLMYSTLMLEEPFAYFFGALGLWLAVRALVLRTRNAWIAAVVSALVGPLIRQELAMLPVVLLLAGLALSWQSGRLSRWRARWPLATYVRSAVLLLGVLIVLDEEMSHVSHTWQLSTRHLKHRMFELGAWAGGALAIGCGVVPLLIGLALLVRAPGEERTRQLSAFRAVLASALASFTVYTAVKAAYLTTTLATRALERNLFYVEPLLFVATAIFLERPRLRLWALAAAAALVGILLWVVPIQLGWPYFEAPGFSILSLFNRELYVAPHTLQSLLLPLGAIGLALVALPMLLRRLPAARSAAVALVALLVIAWNGAGSWAASAGARSSADAEMSHYASPPNWIDDATHGGHTMFIGQTINDATGVWLTEFWNHSVRYVWTLDGSGPGPGPTNTPNILSTDGMIVPRGDVKYVLAGAGIDVVGRVVAAPEFPGSGHPLRLFRIDYPVRYTSTVTGVFNDGWSGSGPVAYDVFGSAGTKPQRLTVSPSRVGGGPATTATIRIGPMTLGTDSSVPRIARVTKTERCRIPQGGTCRVTLTTPRPPYRVEVTVAKTWSPHDFDPRNSDQRQLGAQVGFSASTP